MLNGRWETPLTLWHRDPIHWAGIQEVIAACGNSEAAGCS